MQDVMTRSNALCEANAAQSLRTPFNLPDIRSEFSVGLNAAIQAIRQAKNEISQPENLSAAINKYTGSNHNLDNLKVSDKNYALAFLVGEVASERGWLAGWKCLADACPDAGIHEELLEDSEAAGCYYPVNHRGGIQPSHQTLTVR
jgi:hypothetical protein